MSFCKFFKSSVLVSLATSVAAARIGSSSSSATEQKVDDTTAFLQSEQHQDPDLARALRESRREYEQQQANELDYYSRRIASVEEKIEKYFGYLARCEEKICI